ncbi:MAG: hypothetical protein WBZ20_18055 [Nitrososphaeraceae archaeon]|jgi:hypothetical protein
MWIPFVILAYRIRFCVPLSLATIERSFRIFRQSIYDESLQKLKELKKLSGEIEIDEALFGGYMKGNKRGWGAEGKNPRIWNISEKLKGHHVCCI